MSVYISWLSYHVVLDISDTVLRVVLCQPHLKYNIFFCSPWPEEGLEFTTLWCRAVCASCKEWKFQLRDFPQPLLDIRDLHIWGRLVGAEQEATRRGMIQGTQAIKLTADFICY